MGVYLTIDGISTPVTFGSATNAIQVQSLQFTPSADATKQTIAVGRRITAATPHIYALAMSGSQKSMAIYSFDDDTQESFQMQLGNSTISGWMLTYDAPASPREFFTIEAAQVAMKN